MSKELSARQQFIDLAIELHEKGKLTDEQYLKFTDELLMQVEFNDDDEHYK